MQIEYEEVIRAIENCELEVDRTLYAEYSGRAMYGSKCFGLVGTLGDAFDVVIQLVDILEDAGWVNNVRTDSMGLDMIVYWPDVQIVNIEQDEHEEQFEYCDKDEQEHRVRPDGPDRGDSGLIGQGEY